MITAGQVDSYEDNGFFWAHASDVLATAPDTAWVALERLLTDTLRQVPTIANRPIRVLQTGADGSILAVGAALRVQARVLGAISVPMRLRVIETEPGTYLRMEVNKNFADIDFRIQAHNEGCTLTYRQGFQRGTLLGWIGSRLSFRVREVPETAAILNAWAKSARRAA